MKRSRQYKAFDFNTGKTYLIGEFESKADAKAYCKMNHINTISQTLVALTDEEYIKALNARLISFEKEITNEN